MRLRPLLLLGLASCVAAALVRADDAPRSVRVFRRVQDAVHAPLTPHLNTRDVQRTTLVRTRVAEAGRAITVPVLPPGCGMGPFGGLDAEGTVALAFDLFALHGYVLQPDRTAGGVRLDGLDPQARVGLLLRPAARGDARRRVPGKGETTALDALERAGYRVLVIPTGRYRCMQADTSSPMHASALTIAEFLADQAGERPADLDVLAQGQPLDLAARGLEEGVPGASSVQRSETGVFVVLEQEATVTLAFAPPGTVEGRGRPVLLVLPFYWTPPPTDGVHDLDAATPPAFALLQEGMTPLRSGRAVFLTDGAFDPAKPFRLVVTLRAGQTHLGTVLRVRTSKGRLR